MSREEFWLVRGRALSLAHGAILVAAARVQSTRLECQVVVRLGLGREELLRWLSVWSLARGRGDVRRASVLQRQLVAGDELLERGHGERRVGLLAELLVVVGLVAGRHQLLPVHVCLLIHHLW